MEIAFLRRFIIYLGLKIENRKLEEGPILYFIFVYDSNDEQIELSKIPWLAKWHIYALMGHIQERKHIMHA